MIRMEWLTHELVQEMIDKMMEDTPYSIYIMNEEEIIIGSGTKSVSG